MMQTVAPFAWFSHGQPLNAFADALQMDCILHLLLKEELGFCRASRVVKNADSGVDLRAENTVNECLD